MNIRDSYTREMYDRFDYFACWLPSTRVALGDVGTVRGRQFDKLTDLAALGVEFTEEEPGVLGDVEYATAGGVDIATKSDVTVARVSITFTRKGATFFQASGCLTTGIADLPALGAKLVELPEWRSEYVVVTRLLRTGPATILVSSEQGAKVDVRLDPAALTGPLPLATVNSRASVSTSSSLAARLTVEDGATPLFKAMRLRRSIASRPRLVWRTTGDEPRADSPLVEVTWREFAESV